MTTMITEEGQKELVKIMNNGQPFMMTEVRLMLEADSTVVMQTVQPRPDIPEELEYREDHPLMPGDAAKVKLKFINMEFEIDVKRLS